MNLGVLFSGGKDSTYAMYLAKKQKHSIACLMTVESENPESFMFHTPSISKVSVQAKAMNVPLLTVKTLGEKEKELKQLEKVINKAKKEYQIKGVVTGTVESVYQSTRIQIICDKLGLHCFNPLWQKNQIELIEDLIRDDFIISIIGVFAYPLNENWLGRIIDSNFLVEIKKLYNKYKINPAGEGGEFETFVLGCPLFSKKLEIVDKQVFGKANSWKMEIEVK